jgi:hypothetical protein
MNNLLAEALGSVDRALVGAQRREVEDGRVVVYEWCRGPAGALIQFLNGGEGAVTIGHVMLNTYCFADSPEGQRWYAHERAHVRQADLLGNLYLPLYLLCALFTGLCALVRRRPRLVHDLHPFEVLAERASGRSGAYLS